MIVAGRAMSHSIVQRSNGFQSIIEIIGFDMVSEAMCSSEMV
jgi:hypothetical protein